MYSHCLQELYEPLWDELLERSRGKYEIRAIWITDVAHQAASYAMNEDQLANDRRRTEPRIENRTMY